MLEKMLMQSNNQNVTTSQISSNNLKILPDFQLASRLQESANDNMVVATGKLSAGLKLSWCFWWN